MPKDQYISNKLDIESIEDKLRSKGNDGFVNKHDEYWKTSDGCKGGGCQPVYSLDKVLEALEELSHE